MINLEEEIYHLYKHKSFSNAKFVTSSLQTNNKKYNIILQILEHESGNYSRSLQHLSYTYTSSFYEALAYKKLNENSRALNALNRILENKIGEEKEFNTKLNELILEKRTDVIYELAGDVCRDIFDSKKAFKNYQKAFNLNFLLRHSFFKIYNKKIEANKQEEKILFPNIDPVKFSGTEFDSFVQLELDRNIDIPYCNLELKENYLSNPKNLENKCVYDNQSSTNVTNCYESDALDYLNIKNLMYSEDDKEKAESGLKNIKQFYKDLSDFEGNYEKYKSMTPGFGSYFLKEYAIYLHDIGADDECESVFEYLIKKEGAFCSSLDIYSSILYKKKEKEKLAALSRKLLKGFLNNSITWAVLGNYYSLINDHKKSLSCLKKSLNLNLNPYTLNLIGHEYIQKQEMEVAKGFFNLGLYIEPENYKALVGLGICHFNTQHSENGTYYLKKAINLVPQNLFLRYIFVKNTLKHYCFDECINAIEDVFGFKTEGTKETKIINLYNFLKSSKKKFNEIEEMIIMKFAELLGKLDKKELGKGCISLISEGSVVFKGEYFGLFNDFNRKGDRC